MGKTTTTQKNTYDPAMQKLVTDNVSGARGLLDNYTPYTGQLTADQSPLMGQFFGAASNVQGAGSGLIGQAAGAAQGALGYQPMQITAPTSTAVNSGPAQTYDPAQAMGYLGNASTIDRGAVRDVNLGAFGGDQIRALYNPFETDKVNAALGDYERGRQMQQNNDAAKFGSGAWGGSRQGVEASLTNDAFQRNSMNAANDLRYQGWNSAMNGALAARGQDLSAAQGNQSADYNVAAQNAAAMNANKQYGAGLLGQLGTFNTGQTNAAAEANAGRAQQTGLANQDAALQAATANQSAGLAGNAQQLQGAGLLGQLGQAQSSNALAQTSLLGQAGAAQQGLAQEALDRLAAQHQQDWTNRLNGQQAVTSATGIVPGVTNSTQQTTQSQGFGGIAGGLLGSLGTAAFGLGSMGFKPFGGS